MAAIPRDDEEEKEREREASEGERDEEEGEEEWWAPHRTQGNGRKRAVSRTRCGILAVW